MRKQPDTPAVDNFAQLDRQLAQLPDPERSGLAAALGTSWGLGPVRALWQAVRQSDETGSTGLQDTLVVQIVGSKGKGSCALWLEALLEAAGLRTGVYLSPHLRSRQERIRVAGQMASLAQWSAAFSRVWPLREVATLRRFELETVLALEVFRQAGTSVIILEAGLGGTLDATRVLAPDLMVLTAVEREHTRLLGESIAEITRNKLGALPHGCPLLHSTLPVDALEIATELCTSQRAPRLECSARYIVEQCEFLPQGSRFLLRETQNTHRTHQVEVATRGSHQPGLVALSLTIAEELWPRLPSAPTAPFPHSALDALATRTLPGRLQTIQEAPTILLDVAHTPGSVKAALEACQLHLKHPPDTVLLALNQDKDAPAILALLCRHARRLLLTTTQGARSQSPEILRTMLPDSFAGECRCFASVAQAWDALQGPLAPTHCGLALGSFSLAGALLQHI